MMLEKSDTLAGDVLKLSDVAGGAKGGACWLDGLSAKDKETWKTLSAHAAETIGKESEVAKMKPRIVALTKAPQCVGGGGLY